MAAVKCIGCFNLHREELTIQGKPLVVYNCPRFPYACALSGLLRPSQYIAAAARSCPNQLNKRCVLCPKPGVLTYGDSIVYICKEHDRAWSKWLDEHPARHAYLSPHGRSRTPNWVEVFREFVESMTGKDSKRLDCTECGRELEQMHWNQRGDILLCPNTSCRSFHTPQGWIPKPEPVVTTPSAKADGFLGHARTIVPRYVPNAQSERSVKDITGCVDISVNDKPAVRAKVNTVSKGFRNIGQTPASGAYLRSPVRVDLDKSPTSVFYFVGEFGKERTPSRIADRTSQHTPGQSFDIQILNGNKPVVISNLPAEFMMKVRPLVANVGVSLLEKSDCLSSVITSLLPSGNPSLASPQLSKPHFQVTGIRYPLTIGEGSKRIKPHINTDSFSLGDRTPCIKANTEAGIPLPSITLQGECLNLSCDRAVRLQFDNTDLLNLQPSLLSNMTAVPPGRKGKTIKSISRLEAGIARFLTTLNPAEESPESLIYSSENILAGGVISKVKIARIPYLFKLISLVVVVTTNPLHPPRIPSFLKGSIVKGTGFGKLVLKQSNLLFGRIQAVFVSSALHLFALLRLYVMLDCRSRHAANTSDVVRPAPKGRQARTEARELGSENFRTVSLELGSNMRWRLCRVGFHEQVNVVRHHFKAVNNRLHFLRLSLNQYLQSSSYFIYKHGTAILRTPHKVIFERVYHSRIKVITLLSHILSIPQHYNDVKYLLRKEVGQFLCQINQAVPLP